MVTSERCVLSLCVHSAELDGPAQGSYCKVYVDQNDLSNGTGMGNGDNDVASGSGRSFHTMIDRSDKKTTRPEWNQTFSIEVFDRRNEMLTIRMKSKKLLHVSVVGACAIPLRQIPMGRPVDQWFPLLKGAKRRGKLRLQMMISYAAFEPPQQYQQRPSSTRDVPSRVSSIRERPSSLSSMPSSYQEQPLHQQDHQVYYNHRPSGEQRPSSLTGPVRGSYQQESPYQREPQQQRTRESMQARSPPTLATFHRYQPEEEPIKHTSPQKENPLPAYMQPLQQQQQQIPSLHRAITNESDDDEEAHFPRVAELHRMESDLIGESSEEEDGEAYDEDIAPRSPMYMDAVAEHSATNTSFEDEEEEDVVAPITASAPPPVVAACASSSAALRSSVEISRATRVAVPKEEIAAVLAATQVFAEQDEEEKPDNNQLESVSKPRDSYSDDDNADRTTNASINDVWNRYPSSSSSEGPDDFTFASPRASLISAEQSLAHVSPVVIVDTHEFVSPRSSTSSEPSVTGTDSIEHETGTVNPFVELASPSVSEQEEVVAMRDSTSSEEVDGHTEYDEAQLRYETATTPRHSSSSEGTVGDDHQQHQQLDEQIRYEAASTPRSSSSSEELVKQLSERQGEGDADVHYEAATTPRCSSSSEDNVEYVEVEVTAQTEGTEYQLRYEAATTPRSSSSSEELEPEQQIRAEEEHVHYEVATTPRSSSSSEGPDDDEHEQHQQLDEQIRYEAATTPRSTSSSEELESVQQIRVEEENLHYEGASTTPHRSSSIEDVEVSHDAGSSARRSSVCSEEQFETVEQEHFEAVSTSPRSSSSSSSAHVDESVDQYYTAAPVSSEEVDGVQVDASADLSVHVQSVVVVEHESPARYSPSSSSSDECESLPNLAIKEDVHARLSTPSVSAPLNADRRTLLRTMSSTLTPDQLRGVADDCLPSDSDDSSDDCGSDGEFNFDSDSDEY